MNYIKYREGFKYQLCEDYEDDIPIIPKSSIFTDYVNLNDKGHLIIKKGYAWDGPSGPTIDTLDSMRGSLVHDALYQLMRLNLLSIDNRLAIDDLFWDILIEDGMNEIRAYLWKIGVNNFADKYARYESESPILVAP